jgi:transposase-like protein
MGGDRVDCREDRLLWRHAAQLGAAGRARRWRAVWSDDGKWARLKELERENRELRQANEILRKASAYFAAAELDRRSKP